MNNGSFDDDREVVKNGEVLWRLGKDRKELRCELREAAFKLGGWDIEVFEDDRLAFARRWPLEASARFVGASLRRERLRDGWRNLVSDTCTTTGTASFVKGFLTFVGQTTCVYAPDFLANLNGALNVLGWPTDYRIVNADLLPATDSMRGYPSPSLLWRGREIFGLPTPAPPFQLH